MAQKARTVDEWVEYLTDWVAEADRIIPLPASTARGRSGHEMSQRTQTPRSQVALAWLIGHGVVVREVVHTGEAGAPRHVWRLT